MFAGVECCSPDRLSICSCLVLLLFTTLITPRACAYCFIWFADYIVLPFAQWYIWSLIAIISRFLICAYVIASWRRASLPFLGTPAPHICSRLARLSLIWIPTPTSTWTDRFLCLPICFSVTVYRSPSPPHTPPGYFSYPTKCHPKEKASTKAPNLEIACHLRPLHQESSYHTLNLRKSVLTFIKTS